MHCNDEKNNEKAIEKLKESLDFVDSSVRIEKPPLMKIVELVNQVEEKKESGRNRQFILFVIMAVVVVFAETYAFYRSAVFFAVMQGIALLCILPVIIRIRQKNRQVPDR